MSDLNDDEKRTERSRLGRSYSSGFEFVAAVVGFTLVGFWIDHHYGSSPKGVLICLGLGLVGATYNLIRGSLIANRKAGGAGGAAPGTDRTDRAARPDGTAASKSGEPE